MVVVYAEPTYEYDAENGLGYYSGGEYGDTPRWCNCNKCGNCFREENGVKKLCVYQCKIDDNITCDDCRNNRC